MHDNHVYDSPFFSATRHQDIPTSPLHPISHLLRRFLLPIHLGKGVCGEGIKIKIKKNAQCPYEEISDCAPLPKSCWLFFPRVFFSCSYRRLMSYNGRHSISCRKRTGDKRALTAYAVRAPYACGCSLPVCRRPAGSRPGARSAPGPQR